MNMKAHHGNFPFNVLSVRPAAFLTLARMLRLYSKTHTIILLRVYFTYCLGEGPGSLIIPVREDKI